jgi:hypothetical protein
MEGRALASASAEADTAVGNAKKPAAMRAFSLQLVGRNSDSVFRLFNCLSAQYTDAIAPYVLICPTGCFAIPVSSPSRKNIPVLPLPKSLLYPLPFRPAEGVSRSLRTRGGMRWTRQRQARSIIARTHGAVSAFAEVSADCHKARRSLWRRSRGTVSPTLSGPERASVARTSETTSRFSNFRGPRISLHSCGLPL